MTADAQDRERLAAELTATASFLREIQRPGDANLVLDAVDLLRAEAVRTARDEDVARELAKEILGAGYNADQLDYALTCVLDVRAAEVADRARLAGKEQTSRG